MQAKRLGLPYIDGMETMLWYSAVIMLLLTLFAWWNGRQMKAQKDTAHLGNLLYAAAVIGALGTLCFFLAALI